MSLATDLRELTRDVDDQRGDYLVALELFADRLEDLSVYVAVPEPSDAEPAVFATEAAADAFAATYADPAPVFELLVCDGEVAAAIVAQRTGDEDGD